MANESSQKSAPLGLFDAILLGMGAMIGAGIFVLTGMAAETAGPASVLIFLLNGLVTTLTALSYAELASTIPKRGGGYAFVAEVFPDWVGFVMGWMVWVAYMIAGSLYALGFAPNFIEFLELYLGAVPGATGLYALVAIGVFVGINVLSTAASGRVESLVTLVKVAILVVFVGFGLGAVETGKFQPLFPAGHGPLDLLPAMGLTFVAFEGYDLITTVTEEIEEPRTNVPIAILVSLVATVVLYLLVVFVAVGTVGAERLGAAGEVAIAEASKSFMPAIPGIGAGSALITFGAIFSTISALNAVLLASSRVVFAMGRNGHIWRAMGRLSAATGTPVFALLVNGVCMGLVVTLLPIRAVGNLTSLFFLFAFITVNAAVIKLRWDRPDQTRPFEIPYFPVPPLLAIVLNVGVGLFIDWQIWLLAVGWLAIGGLVYERGDRRVATVRRVMMGDRLRIVVAGVGRVGLRAAELLYEQNHDIVLIEEGTDRGEEIAGEINASIIRGDATRPSILEQADLAAAD
ncbi:MAG: amino acid permease, partial [Bradymonadaceae bacterium]